MYMKIYDALKNDNLTEVKVNSVSEIQAWSISSSSWFKSPHLYVVVQHVFIMFLFPRQKHRVSITQNESLRKKELQTYPMTFIDNFPLSKKNDFSNHF